MKNIHVLPTDKPSRLHLSPIGLFLLDRLVNPNSIYSHHIYITSDEKPKSGDYALHIDMGIITKVVEKVKFTFKKIILTTDPDLIKDSVQAIDDEFLEWLVKNHTYNFVEVKKGFEDGSPYGYNFLDYKIIIPKEEPKKYPIGGYAPGYYSCKCVTCKIKFTGDKRAVQCEPCAIKTTQETPKQETLEEFAERISRAHDNDNYKSLMSLVIDGANFKAERMFSEEDIDKLISNFTHDLKESTSTSAKEHCEGAIFGLNMLKKIKKK